MLRRVVCRLLGDAFETFSAQDASAALELLAANDIDVVLTDYDMPGPSGLDLLWTCANRWPGARRVLMSGGQVPELDDWRDLGVVGAFFAKPIAAQDLLRLLSPPAGTQRDASATHVDARLVEQSGLRARIEPAAAFVRESCGENEADRAWRLGR